MTGNFCCHVDLTSQMNPVKTCDVTQECKASNSALKQQQNCALANTGTCLGELTLCSLLCQVSCYLGGFFLSLSLTQLLLFM